MGKTSNRTRVPVLDIQPRGGLRLKYEPRFTDDIAPDSKEKAAGEICSPSSTSTQVLWDEYQNEANAAFITGISFQTEILRLCCRLLKVTCRLSEREHSKEENASEMTSIFSHLAFFCLPQSIIRAMHIKEIISIIETSEQPNWTNATLFQDLARGILTAWRSETNRSKLSYAEWRGLIPHIENELRKALKEKNTSGIAFELSTLEKNPTPLQSSVIMAQMHMRLNDIKMMADKSGFNLCDRAARLMARWEEDWKEFEKEWNSNCDRKRQPFKHSFAATKRVASLGMGGCYDDEDLPSDDDPSDEEEPPSDDNPSDEEEPPSDDDSSDDGNLSDGATALISHNNFTGGLKRKIPDSNAVPATTLPATPRRTQRAAAPRKDFEGDEWTTWADLRIKRQKKKIPLKL